MAITFKQKSPEPLSAADRLRVEQTCEALGIGKCSLYKWVKGGKFPPPFKIGGKNYWRKSVVESFLADCMSKAA